MTKMKIAFLSVFHPYRGGISQFSANLCEALWEGNEVTAFNFSRQYPGFLFPGKTQYVAEGDDTLKIESRRTLDSINPFTWFRTAREIAAEKPDVAILTYWMSFFAPALGVIARYLRRHGIRTVTVVHNAIPHEPKPYDKPFAKWFFKKSDAFVSMCDAVSSDIRSLKGDAVILQRQHPLYNHFGEKMDRPEAAAALGISPERKTLLFFGLIRDYKGLDLLIDAMSLLDDSYQLVIAGECYGSFDKYEAQIAASSAKERIKVFNQYIDDAQVPSFFSASDLCVLPYRSATQSGITAVSMHFEVPMVATRVGGLAETIEGNGAGVMAESVTPEAIASAIKSIFAAGADKYSESIREAKKNMTWKAFAENLTEFCRKI